MNDHKEHIDEIAQAAATLYGQEWQKLPMWTKERWRETVRHTARGGGESGMDRFAGQAIDDWYKAQEAAPVVEVEAVEAEEAPPKQKSKKK